MCGGGLIPVGLGVLCAAYHAPMLEVTTRKNCRCRGDGDPSASYLSTFNGNNSCNVVSAGPSDTPDNLPATTAACVGCTEASVRTDSPSNPVKCTVKLKKK